MAGTDTVLMAVTTTAAAGGAGRSLMQWSSAESEPGLRGDGIQLLHQLDRSVPDHFGVVQSDGVLHLPAGRAKRRGEEWVQEWLKREK